MAHTKQGWKYLHVKRNRMKKISCRFRIKADSSQFDIVWEKKKIDGFFLTKKNKKRFSFSVSRSLEGKVKTPISNLNNSSFKRKKSPGF